MSAAGRVAIGFSKPWVADYSNTGNIISFSNAMLLARGVGVNIDPDSSDDNVFYADNQAAETDTGTFTGGGITLTVDGLFTKAARFLYGWKAADADGWVAVDDTAKTGYKAVGYITKYMSDGGITYVPTIIVKTSWNQPGEELNTQEDEIDWQTVELEGRILRGDDANHTWKFVSETEYISEETAENALKAKLGYVAPRHTVTQTLTNVTSDYTGTSIADGSSLTANLTADSGYDLDTVTVTMGGTDITSAVYASGTVTISSVTDDVVITATAVSTGA